MKHLKTFNEAKKSTLKVNSNLYSDELVDALREENLDVNKIKDIIDKGADVNYIFSLSYDKTFPLSYLIDKVNSKNVKSVLAVMKLLIAAGADINKRIETDLNTSVPIIFKAAHLKGNIIILKTLIESGADLAAVDEYSNTFFRDASKPVLSWLKEPKTIEYLLSKEPYLYYAYDKIYVELLPDLKAKYKDKAETAKKNLKIPVDKYRLMYPEIVKKDTYNTYAKYYTKDQISAELIRKLKRPLRDEEGIEQLLDAGPNLNYQDHQGTTVLMRAAIMSPYYLDYILKLKPNLNAVNNDGDTALIYLAEGGTDEYDKKSCKMLIEAGIDITITNKEGRNFIDEASYKIKEWLCNDGVQMYLIDKYPIAYSMFVKADYKLSENVKKRYPHLSSAADLNLF